MSRKTIILLALLCLSAFVLSACSKGGASASVDLPPLPSETSPPASPAPAPTATVPAPTDTAPQPTPVEQVADTPPEPLPTVRAGLEATDPTGVVLASGEPTLVEFFAFW